MKLVDDPKCIYCGSEYSLILASLERKHVTSLLRDAIDQYVKITEIDQIFGKNNGDILMLAAKEVIYI